VGEDVRVEVLAEQGDLAVVDVEQAEVALVVDPAGGHDLAHAMK
jgi:hypothetical protein